MSSSIFHRIVWAGIGVLCLSAWQVFVFKVWTQPLLPFLCFSSWMNDSISRHYTTLFCTISFENLLLRGHPILMCQDHQLKKGVFRKGSFRNLCARAFFCVFLCSEVIFSCKSHRNFFQKLPLQCRHFLENPLAKKTQNAAADRNLNCNHFGADSMDWELSTSLNSTSVTREVRAGVIQASKKSTRINFLGPETARWGGGLPREGVVAEKFVPSIESFLGLRTEDLGYPGNFARISRTPRSVQTVGAKKARARFSFPNDCLCNLGVHTWVSTRTHKNSSRIRSIFHTKLLLERVVSKLFV